MGVGTDLLNVYRLELSLTRSEEPYLRVDRAWNWKHVHRQRTIERDLRRPIRRFDLITEDTVHDYFRQLSY